MMQGNSNIKCPFKLLIVTSLSVVNKKQFNAQWQLHVPLHDWRSKIHILLTHWVIWPE